MKAEEEECREEEAAEEEQEEKQEEWKEEEEEECISVATLDRPQPSENAQQGDEEAQRECKSTHAPAAAADGRRPSEMDVANERWRGRCQVAVSGRSHWLRCVTSSEPPTGSPSATLRRANNRPATAE